MHDAFDCVNDLCWCLRDGAYLIANRRDPERRKAERAAVKSSRFKRREEAWIVDTGMLKSGTVGMLTFGDDGKLHYLVSTEDKRQYLIPAARLYKTKDEAISSLILDRSGKTEETYALRDLFAEEAELHRKQKIALGSARYSRRDEAYFIDSRAGKSRVLKCIIEDVSADNRCTVFYTVRDITRRRYLLVEDRLYKTMEEAAHVLMQGTGSTSGREHTI